VKSGALFWARAIAVESVGTKEAKSVPGDDDIKAALAGIANRSP
jgi:hypothetical protein